MRNESCNELDFRFKKEINFVANSAVAQYSSIVLQGNRSLFSNVNMNWKLCINNELWLKSTSQLKYAFSNSHQKWNIPSICVPSVSFQKIHNLVPVSRIADLSISTKSAKMHIFRLSDMECLQDLYFNDMKKWPIILAKFVFYSQVLKIPGGTKIQKLTEICDFRLIVKYEISPTFVFQQYITWLILAKFIFLSLDQKLVLKM